MKYKKYKIDSSAGRLSLKLKIVVKNCWQCFFKYKLELTKQALLVVLYYQVSRYSIL
jgi:hypothetical protein